MQHTQIDNLAIPPPGQIGENQYLYYTVEVLQADAHRAECSMLKGELVSSMEGDTV